MDNVVALNISAKKYQPVQHPDSTVKPAFDLDFTKLLTVSSYLEPIKFNKK